MSLFTPPPLSGLAVMCGIACFLLNSLLMPLYRQYALARPGARSSPGHQAPTPQGGGLGVLLAMGGGLLGYAVLSSEPALAGHGYWALAAGGALLAVTGALDDVRQLPVLPRLFAQAAAAGLGLYAVLSRDLPLAHLVPLPLAALVLGGGLVWFINLTNFMDGIDGITIAEFMPVSGALAILAELGGIPFGDGLIAAALLGAMCGFAPHNRAVAKLYLGDVGSLAIGLIAGTLLLALALDGSPVAALILPLYYLADATITLVRRLLRGENVTQAHRTHFYQQAQDHGWPVPAITRRVMLLNLALAVLAIGAVWWGAWPVQAACLFAAAALVALVLRSFTRPPRL